MAVSWKRSLRPDQWSEGKGSVGVHGTRREVLNPWVVLADWEGSLLGPWGWSTALLRMDWRAGSSRTHSVLSRRTQLCENNDSSMSWNITQQFQMNKTDLYVLIHKVMVKKMPPLLEHGKICMNPYYKNTFQNGKCALWNNKGKKPRRQGMLLTHPPLKTITCSENQKRLEGTHIHTKVSLLGRVLFFFLKVSVFSSEYILIYWIASVFSCYTR